MRAPVVALDTFKISGQILQDCFADDARQRVWAREFLQRSFVAARTYRKSVVVKGVEDPGQISLLLALGFDPAWDLVQGNAYHPPLDLAGLETVYRAHTSQQHHAQLMDLFHRATIRVLYQKSQMLIDICSYFRRTGLGPEIAVAQSYSELWSTHDRNLVVILGYDFVSLMVSPDQLKDQSRRDETWQALVDQGLLFEIPGLSMALIDNFQDSQQVADRFELVERYDGHNLYQILIAINREKTLKIPFIILSQTDTQMQQLEENVLILDRLEHLEDFADSFVAHIQAHPQAIGKFKRL